jgi:hypothetical protein
MTGAKFADDLPIFFASIAATFCSLVVRGLAV